MDPIERAQPQAYLQFYTKVTGQVFGHKWDAPIVNQWGALVVPKSSMREHINAIYSDFVSQCLQSIVEDYPMLTIESILETQRKLTIDLGVNMSFCSFRGTAYMVEFVTIANGQLV